MVTVSSALYDEQEYPEGTTETVIPRRGRHYPIRYITTVSKAADYEQVELPMERDPLTKRGRRRVIHITTHPKWCGYRGVWRRAQASLMAGFIKQTEEWAWFGSQGAAHG